MASFGFVPRGTGRAGLGMYSTSLSGGSRAGGGTGAALHHIRAGWEV